MSVQSKVRRNSTKRTVISCECAKDCFRTVTAASIILRPNVRGIVLKVYVSAWGEDPMAYQFFTAREGVRRRMSGPIWDSILIILQSNCLSGGVRRMFLRQDIGVGVRLRWRSREEDIRQPKKSRATEMTGNSFALSAFGHL